jgi:hypothetical protein
MQTVGCFLLVRPPDLDGIRPRGPLLLHHGALFARQHRLLLLLLLLLLYQPLGSPVDGVLRHYVFAVTHGDLLLSFSGVVGLSHSFLVSVALSPFRPGPVGFLAAVQHHPFGVVEHLLTPQFEEVVGVGVEFQTVFAVVPVTVQFVEWGWLVARFIRLEHRRRHRRPRKDLEEKFSLSTKHLLYFLY